jgi:hypothetical protein
VRKNYVGQSFPSFPTSPLFSFLHPFLLSLPFPSFLFSLFPFYSLSLFFI